MKAAVLALKAGAEREDLKAEVPRRSADAIVTMEEKIKKNFGLMKNWIRIKLWESLDSAVRSPNGDQRNATGCR